MKGILALFVTSFILCSCTKHEEYDISGFNSDTVILKSGGKTVFEYEEDSCQMSFNRGRREFRAGTDNMSDYFILNLSSLPSEEGELLPGRISWTTRDNIIVFDRCVFEVMKLSPNGAVWLWNAKQDLSLTVWILD